MAGKSRFSPVQLSLNTQAVIDATPIWRVSINNRLCVKKKYRQLRKLAALQNI